MSLIEVSNKSIEFKLSFFHQIGPKIMSRMDESDPGFVTKIYNNLSENNIFKIFLETCERKGFEICKDNGNKYWLVKTSESNHISKKIYRLIEEHSKRNNFDKNDVYRIHTPTNKSVFSLLAKNTLKASSGKEERKGSDNYWVFGDKSCIEVGLTTIKSWGGSIEVSEINFENFIANYRESLDELCFEKNTSKKTEEILFI